MLCGKFKLLSTGGMRREGPRAEFWVEFKDVGVIIEKITVKGVYRLKRESRTGLNWNERKIGRRHFMVQNNFK